ncbi:MAG: pentapeptide repeat-containing protein [Neisseriaceae bacterium]
MNNTNFNNLSLNLRHEMIIKRIPEIHHSDSFMVNLIRIEHILSFLSIFVDSRGLTNFLKGHSLESILEKNPKFPKDSSLFFVSLREKFNKGLNANLLDVRVVGLLNPKTETFLCKSMVNAIADGLGISLLESMVDEIADGLGIGLFDARADKIKHNYGIHIFKFEENLTKFRQADDRNPLYLSGLNLDGFNWEGVEFKNLNISGFEFKNIKFQGAYFYSVEFEGVKFVNVDFTEVEFMYVEFHNCTFQNVNFEKSRLTAKFQNMDLRGVYNLETAEFKNTHFQGCDLQGVSFKGAYFEQVTFMDYFGSANYQRSTNLMLTDMRFANLNNANVDADELKDTLLEGAISNNPAIRQIIEENSETKRAQYLELSYMCFFISEAWEKISILQMGLEEGALGLLKELIHLIGYSSYNFNLSGSNKSTISSPLQNLML